MYFASSEISDQPICMYELGRYISRMQMRFPGDWNTRILVSSEIGYKRIEDVRTQTALATNRKVSVHTICDLDDNDDDLIKNHAVDLVFLYERHLKYNER